ncbi:MAG: HD domain-containing protein [Candidatus Micrarchaeales archaeon]|nr:HD domain-containing protein [Candidatus Micrarchaeales archaeon]
MQINEIIYGSFEINEPVILELLNSKAVQRVKRVSHIGHPLGMVPKNAHYFTRYDHCFGVMLLLRKLGAGLEEQIAGLLHDISHTAFSHVADHLFADPTVQNYQDKVHLEYLMKTDIAGILEKYKVNLKKIAHLESFTMLENELPDICADRLDYTFREYYWADPEAVGYCLSNLIVYNGEIAFKDKPSALKFAEGYLKCNRESWMYPEYILRYILLADAIRLGLDKNSLKKEDITFGDDETAIAKLRSMNDPKVNKILNALSSDIKFELNDKKEGVQLLTKFRYVDPKFISGNELVRLSSVDATYKAKIDEEKRFYSKPMYAKVEL